MVRGFSTDVTVAQYKDIKLEKAVAQKYRTPGILNK